MAHSFPVEHEARAQWLMGLVGAGTPPDRLVASLVGQGWEQDRAVEEIERVLRAHLEAHAHPDGLPPPVPVPAPVLWNGASRVFAHDRHVDVLAHLVQPPIVVFGNVLGADECRELIEAARGRLRRSTTVDLATGDDTVHADRTSEGMCFRRGEVPVCARIEARLAALAGWPLENGEGLQVLRYGPGAEYRPHHDYFPPEEPGTEGILKRGGQRVASIVMYLNTPTRGGATVFPEAKLQVGAVQGNAVFFSYDRPHPATRSLHGGAPVLEGEKWVATKWLRERPHE